MSDQLHSEIAVLKDKVDNQIIPDIKVLKDRTHTINSTIQSHDYLIKDNAKSNASLLEVLTEFKIEVTKAFREVKNVKYWILGAVAAGSAIMSGIILLIKFFPDFVKLLVG